MRQFDLTSFNVEELEKKLENMFSHFPVIPITYKEVLVRYIPSLSLTLGLIIILSSLVSFISTGIVSPLELPLLIYYLRLVFDFLIGVLFLLSYSPLLKKQFKGWHTLLYANLLTSIVLLMAGDMVFLMISIVCLYTLFQIKYYYVQS